MHILELLKPDGRGLTLYSSTPLPAGIEAPSPFPRPLEGGAHLRWHPLRGEWVTYAAFRQDRTFLPPSEYNPLAPTTDPAIPTEVPGGPWDIAVFDNRFPSLGASSPPPELIVPAAEALGRCEVVVYSQDSRAPLGSLPVEHIAMLLAVLGDRTARLGGLDFVQYVLPFENRGVEVGVTLHHPHGQIYAYPVVPPIPARMQQIMLQHYEVHGRGLLADHIEREREEAMRMLYEGEHGVAFVPAFARYPYETLVAPLLPYEHFGDLDEATRLDLARALKTVLLKYDALWGRPMPYIMAWYQPPTDGLPHPEWHLHAEIYPAYRSRDRLKYLAGTEIAAGFFAMDALPEEKARELMDVKVTLE